MSNTPKVPSHEVDAPEVRRSYVAPRVSKRRSVARVTLFSGGGATAGGLTATG